MACDVLVIVCLCAFAGVGSRMVHGSTGVPWPVECMADALRVPPDQKFTSTTVSRPQMRKREKLNKTFI